MNFDYIGKCIEKGALKGGADYSEREIPIDLENKDRKKGIITLVNYSLINSELKSILYIHNIFFALLNTIPFSFFEGSFKSKMKAKKKNMMMRRNARKVKIQYGNEIPY